MIRVLVLLTYFLIFFNLSKSIFISFCFSFLFYFFNILVPMSEEERKRQNLIAELYSTETAYVDNLKLVFEVRQNHSPLWSRNTIIYTSSSSTRCSSRASGAPTCWPSRTSPSSSSTGRTWSWPTPSCWSRWGSVRRCSSSRRLSGTFCVKM